MRAWFLMIPAVLGLAACSTPSADKVASDEDVARSAYTHDGPPRLTLFTMIGNEKGEGAHTSLLINGSQRIAFDPAGSFRHDNIVSRHDVVFGMTPFLVDYYTRFHARETYHVVVQKLDVSPEVAEMALQKALAYGPVSQAHCANSTSDILNDLPGFEGIKQTYYPKRLMNDFAEMGATYDRLYEYDDDDKSKVLAAFVPEYMQGKEDRLAKRAGETVATRN